ncbi:MAG: hypothetical protein LBH44_12665 [Treponema sp.]|nr:hypothetical protein [Treponema sp.]
MGSYLQILALVVIGIVLLWLGYSLFLGPLSPFFPGIFFRKRYDGPESKIGTPGDPQVCPVCSTKLMRGELVKSHAYPSVTGGKDRLMHIQGCFACLQGSMQRKCPVCGIILYQNDYLISRMFERSHTRNHVHVLGCNHCRKAGRMR